MDATLPMDDDVFEDELFDDDQQEGSVVGHLVMLSPQQRETGRYPIRIGLNTIGRAPRDRNTKRSINHIQINDPTISSQHATIDVKRLPQSTKLSDVARPFVTARDEVLDLDLIQITIVGSNPSSLSDTFAASAKLSESKVRLFKNTPRVLTHNMFVFLGSVCLKFELADFRAGVARTEAEKKRISNNRLHGTPEVDATLAYNDSPSPDPLSNRLTPTTNFRSSPPANRQVVDPDATLVVDPDAEIEIDDQDFDENATQVYADKDDDEEDDLNETAATLAYDEDDVDENAATLPLDDPVHFDDKATNGYHDDDEMGETLSLNIDMDDDYDDDQHNQSINQSNNQSNQSINQSNHRQSNISPIPLSPTFDSSQNVSQKEDETRRERERVLKHEQDALERGRLAKTERERKEAEEHARQQQQEEKEEKEKSERKAEADRKAAERKAEADRKAAERKAEIERKAVEKQQAEERKRQQQEEEERVRVASEKAEKDERERIAAEQAKAKSVLAAPVATQWKTKNKRKSDDVSAASSPSKPASRSNSNASVAAPEPAPLAPEPMDDDDEEDSKPASKRAPRAKPAAAPARGKRRRAIVDDDDEEAELETRPVTPQPSDKLPDLHPLPDTTAQTVASDQHQMDLDEPVAEHADVSTDTTLANQSNNQPNTSAAPLRAISITGANTTPDFDELTSAPSYRNTAKKAAAKKRGRVTQAEKEDEPTDEDSPAPSTVRSKRRKTAVDADEDVAEEQREQNKPSPRAKATRGAKAAVIDTTEQVDEEPVVEQKKPSPRGKVARGAKPVVKKEEVEEKPAGRATRTLSRSRSSAGESPRPVSAITVDKPVILFTGIPNHMDFEPDIVRLGGAITEQVDQATHLVTDKVRRTDKFLSAFSITPHLMSLQWLNESIEKDGWRDDSETKYHLKDPASEKQYGFKINNRTVGSNWLSGTSIFRTPSLPVPEAATKLIVESAGGTFLNSQPDKFSEHTLIVGDAKDTEMIDELCALGYRVHDKEMLLSGILRQSLDVQSHIIQEPQTGTRTKAKRGKKR